MKHLQTNISFLLVVCLILIGKPSSDLQANAVCLGVECSFLSNEEYLAAYLAEPLLGSIYGNGFLNSMADSAVLQNVNSTLMGGSLIHKNRVSLGYSIARSKIENRFPLIDQTELRSLPTIGAAVSPNLTFATNLGHFLDKSGEWRKLNVHLQFFSYYPSEINLLFLNIRNVNVKGRVANFSANVRYFPFAIDSTPNKEIDSDSKIESDSVDWKSGISFGLGLYRTDQYVILDTYDRRPTQIVSNGQRRRWIGLNELRYESEIYTGSGDVRYAYGWKGFSFFGGIGLIGSQGRLSIRAERYALISSRTNNNDFDSNPTGVGINLKLNEFYQDISALGILGLQFTYQDFGFGLEYMKSFQAESVNFGIQYYF